jgi:hypothetical protein
VTDQAPTAARRSWLFELLLLLGLLVGGVVLALVWRAIDPHTVHLGDSDETNAGIDGTLILLGPLAGILSAGFVLLRPGRMPLTRTVVAVVGSTLGALITWKVGDLIADPNLRAVAATFVWPLSTSIFLFLGAMLPVTSARLQPPPRPSFEPPVNAYPWDVHPGSGLPWSSPTTAAPLPPPPE